MKSDLTVEYLAEVIHYGQQRLVSYQSTSSLVASSLLLDAYPHGCHMFEPGYTFDSLYAGLLRASVLKVYTRNESFPDFMAGEVRKAFIRLWNRHSDSGMTRNVLHQQVLSAGRPLWKHFKSSKCCTACFTNTAVHVQKCGHTLCDLCVQRHGITEGPEYCYSIARCPLCAAEAELLVRVKPPTSGVRLLTIDGGGCRGVIPLQFLTLLQEQIGEGCSVMELFDLAVGTSSGGLIVLSLFLYGWSPRKGLRIFEEVASKLFTRTAVKTNFGPKIQEYLRWWLSDGKYSGSTVDQCFKSIFGESRSLFGWAERQRSGTRVAVTTTSVPDASCVLLTNYNASMPRTKRIGYETPQHSTFEGGLKVWQAARATTAAPGYFPPAELSSRVLQDGALCYNNPIDVGSREARIIWPQNNFPDVVLSLGTGTTVGKEVDRPQRIVKLPRVAHNFLYGFVPRITKSVAKQFDGHNAWTNYSNRSLGCVQAQEFRLDLQLDNAPAIDDTASMPSLKAMVADQPGGGAMRAELATALLTASFFFELTALPRYIGGRYHCHGVIRCRNSAPELLSRLEDLCGTPLEVVKDNSYLGTISALDDICFECSRYGKKIAFHVTSLTDMVLLCLRSPMQPQCRLSGFPQNMQWFCERQGLDACFGASGGFLSKRDCGSCRSTKRKGGANGWTSSTELQINPPQLFDRHPRAEQASQAAHSGRDFHLRETRPILEEFQAGWGTISHLVHAGFPIVFEKTIQCSGRPERLVTTSHPNLVNLLGFRKEDSNIHLIYESMVVSLAEILASPSPALRPYEIAALCAEVLSGLQFLEEDLGCSPRSTCEDVLFTAKGEVKIGKVGEMLVAEQDDGGQNGVNSLVEILSRCQSGRSADGPETATLRAFMTDAASLSYSQLTEHDFLRTSPGTGCLIPHVYIAQRSVLDELAMHNSSPIPAFTSPSSESEIASPENQSDRPDSCDCKSLRCQLRLSHRELEMQRQVYVVDVARLEKSLSAEKAQRLALETRFDDETREGQHTVLQDRITELQRGNEKLWREIQLERAKRQQTLSESARLVVQTRKQIEERDRCLRAMRSALTKSDGRPRLRAVADVEHEFSQLSEMHRSLVNKAKNDHRHEEVQET
ncbi:hypothetical protein BST61_g11308 [Cercospora zeina]